MATTVPTNLIYLCDAECCAFAPTVTARLTTPAA